MELSEEQFSPDHKEMKLKMLVFRNFLKQAHHFFDLTGSWITPSKPKLFNVLVIFYYNKFLHLSIFFLFI